MRSASSIASLMASLLAFLSLCPGIAAAGDDLYRAVTFVTGQMEETRGPGLARCLEDVLVKVSGDPQLIGDPAVVALSAQAATLVADFSYRDRMAGIPVHDEQGTRDRPYDLTVNFQPTKIGAALRSLGREPWTAARPHVVAFVEVRTGKTAYALTSDGERGQGQREALATAADRYAIPIALPSERALGDAGLSIENLAAAYPTSLEKVAKTFNGDAALIGSLVWSDEALSWIADWRLASAGKAYRWRISGINFDDAFRNAVRGTAQVLSGHGQPN
jgi:hypothetical protein